MNWHETRSGAVLADETGKIIGEVLDPSFTSTRNGSTAKFGTKFLGRYISRRTACDAVMREALTGHKLVGSNPTIVIHDDQDGSC